jgi:urease beta subunit
MADIRKLKELSVDDLLKELRARTAKAGKSALANADEPMDSLREFDDSTIVTVLKENQKVIYGVDERIDVFQLPAGPNLDDADSVVALFEAGRVADNGDGTSTLHTVNFGVAQNLCAGERFRNQPTGAFCSGFLVAPDIIATAGHCIDADNVTAKRFVFGFRMRDANIAETVINNGEIYSGVSIIGRQQIEDGPDWALVRINRPVTNHRIARIRRTGRIGDTQAVQVIGHPSGLPTKFTDGAAVRNNEPEGFFVANLDSYGGNSGSPVFNSDTHEVEGILVRGETDFVAQGDCMVSLVCPDTGCRGEDCTRTTVFAQLFEAAPGLATGPDSSLTSWIVPDNGDEHIVVLDADGMVLEFFFTRASGHWQHGNISDSAGIRLAPASSLTSWIVPDNGDEHVVGLDAQGRVHECFFTRQSGRWQHGNISDSTGIGLAPASSLTSWIVPDNGDEHVVGLDAEGAVHEFFFTRASGRWQHGNISDGTGIRLAPGSSLTSWIVPDNGDEHVVGLDAEGAVHEFFFTRDAGRWQHGNISDGTGIRLAPASSLTSWIVPDNGDEHVVGLGPKGTVHEFTFTRASGRWQHGSISDSTGIRLAPASSLSSWIVPDNGDEHVVGLDAEGTVHECFFTRASGRWQHGNISESAGVRLAPASSLTSWIVPDNGDEHVVGLDTGGRVHEFFFTRASGRWQHAFP